MKIKSELFRNSSLTIGGNVAGQAIALAVYPIVTRIYSDADFGLFATYMSVCGLLTILATARFEESLVIARDRGETLALLGLSLKWLVVFLLLLFAVFSIAAEPILNFFGIGKLVPLWRFLPLTVALMGLLALCNNLATREKRFGVIARASVVQNTVNSASRPTLGRMSFTGIGLILSNILGLAAACIAYFPLRKQFACALRGNLREEWRAALYYSDFPTFNLARSLLNSFSVNLPFLFLIGHFGAEKLGLFSLAYFFVSTPVNLVSGSLYSTFFEKISSSVRQKQSLRPFIKDYWKALCLFVLPCFAIAGMVAPPVFGFVFGSQWEESGIYFRMLLPWMFALLAMNPTFPALLVFRRQRQTLFVELLYLAVRWGGLAVGVCCADFGLGILLFSLAGMAITFVYLRWIYVIIKRYDKTDCRVDS